MRKHKSPWPVKHSSLLDATGRPLTSQALDQVTLLNPTKLPSAYCMVKAPNGDKEMFSHFAVYGINAEGAMAMAYCELVDLAIAFEELMRIFNRALVDMPTEERRDLFNQIKQKQEELDAIRAAASQSKGEVSQLDPSV